MQKFSQKYTIICLLEDKNEGYEFLFSDWPLHVTLADTFAVEWDADRLKSELKNIAKNLGVIQSAAIRSHYFGSEKRVHVILIDKTIELESMHNSIVNALKNGDVIFNDPQFNEEGFLPHSTVQKHARVKVGERIKFNNLALVDMFPDKDPYRRKILKLVNVNT